MESRVNLDHRDGVLQEVMNCEVKEVVVGNFLPEGAASEPFVSVGFTGTPVLTGYLTPEAAESLFWKLAEIYSPVSVSKLRLVATTPSKMAEKSAGRKS